MSTENILELRALIQSIPTNPETGCKIWTRGKSSNGYPVMRFTRKDRSAIGSHLGLVSMKETKNTVEKVHRIVYQYLKLGGAMIDREHYIIQSCGNRLCVNPEHLESILNRDLRKRIAAEQKAKRDKERVMDEVVKESRQRNMQTKLAPYTINEIYNSLDSVRETARAFGVSANTVQKIKSGKLHTNITNGIPYARELCKLSDEDVRFIRSMKGIKGLRELSLKYRVHPQTISNVWTGRSHKEVK